MRRTRKGSGLLGFGTKTESANRNDCLSFFHPADNYLPKNAKEWNEFIDANKLGLQKLVYNEKGTEGQVTEAIMRDYERDGKQFCGNTNAIREVRFPGRSFRSGFTNRLSLANGNVIGGKRRKRTKRSK